jgi:hypothetical protein
VCHWPGIYYNGEELGFNIFKEVVRRIHARYDNLIWMKLSEIARYWAARELTKIEKEGNRVTFRAPFATKRFTVRVPADRGRPPRLTVNGNPVSLRGVTKPLAVESGTCYAEGGRATVCFDLQKGEAILAV